MRNRRSEIVEDNIRAAQDGFINGRISAEEFVRIKHDAEKRNMESAFSKEEIPVDGMTCRSCEKRIKRAVMHIEGVRNCSASYEKGIVNVEFSPEKTGKKEIEQAIEKEGYACCEKKQASKARLAAIAGGVLVAMLGIYLVLKNTTGLGLPDFGQNISLGILFAAGLMTGFHCVAMCGGFMVSYSAKSAKEKKPGFLQHLYYGAGKTLSYAVFGGLFGLLGAFIAFTPLLRGWVAILAGLFLVLFGLKMLDVVPFLREMQVRQPKFIDRINAHFGGHAGPFATGLLNGLLIACGPLLAIYIYAAATGSFLYGAISASVFGLGTLPVLFGFGIITSAVSANATRKILKYSGVFVLILGAIMLNRGLSLTGSGYDYNTLTSGFTVGSAGSNAASAETIAVKDGYQEIRMDVTRYGWEPNKFVLKKGVPVKWIINGREITGCNNAIQVPSLGLDFKISKGLQTIEFTPGKAGTVSWSCWMGMIPGVFIVKDDIDVKDTAAVQKELDSASVPRGGSCGGSGGCGCGGGR